MVTSILSSAASALRASQTALNTTSNNISNASTPGYARQEVQFSARVAGSQIQGVEVAEVRRVTDEFLAKAAREAMGRAGEASVVFDALDRAQAAFGDPTNASLVDSINDLFESFGDLAIDPASPPRRSEALNDVNLLFQQYNAISQQLDVLRQENDTRIVTTTQRINQLLSAIPDLSAQLTRDRAGGFDNSGVEDELSMIMDELSQYLDVRAIVKSSGQIEVRTNDGLLLADREAAVLRYTGQGATGAGVAYDPIMVEYSNTPPVALDQRLQTGELRGLLDARDRELPSIAVQLGELAALTADALNAAHNDNVAYPAPNSLTGRNTGLVGTDALRFSGEATYSTLAANGTLNNTVAIDFDAGTMTLNGVVQATPNFAGPGSSINNFITDFNAMGVGTMALNNGVLSVTGPAGDGVAFTQNAADPSSRSGQGFSHFFGLNDMVRGGAGAPPSYRTGLTGTDAHGLNVGGRLDLQLVSDRGEELADVSVTVPAGDMNALLGALNAVGTGLGSFGAFSLDANGELGFQPNGAAAGSRLVVRDDTTVRGDTAMSGSDFFGLGDGARADRAKQLGVDGALINDPSRLALGRLDPADATYVVGQVVTGTGDSGGAQALQLAATARLPTSSAGSLDATTTTLLDYTGRVTSDVGIRASSAESRMEVADTLRLRAEERRGSVEGVNLDEELVKLTQYQEAYNAAARLLQVAQEMTDTLLSVI